MSRLSRRDFLKLTALFSAGTLLNATRPRGVLAQEKKPNIIILLADAMSASHLSVYGYGQRTTPNLERIAERAIIYHSHHAGGNYTTSGTASILTGTYPWTHRAINLGAVVQRSLAKQNIYSLLGVDYYRAGFSQNILAEPYLRQFSEDIDLHIPFASFVYRNRKPVIRNIFEKDPLMGFYSMDSFMMGRGSASMAYLDLMYQYHNQGAGAPTGQYPYGLPSNSIYYYENSVVYDGIRQIILNLHQENRPFFAYFHLMSPHSPYSPTNEFVNSMENVIFPTKKAHPLGNHVSPRELLKWRKQYDEYIANVDAEIGKLIDSLQQAGVLEDTYLFILADHGEMFERGVLGHVTPLLYEPIIHIPLLVFVPGQSNRVDIHALTSNTDILPTILSLAGRPIPDGVEGRILPGLGGQVEPDRPIISIEAKESSSFQPLSRASISMIIGSKKIIYLKGYKKYPDTFELYDLKEDPEEKRDLYSYDTITAARMKEELLDRLDWADRPFRRKNQE